MDIKGKPAMVVGGASGMGRATAAALAEAGATVAVLDRPGSPGKDVAAEIGGLFVECDASDFAGTEAAVAAAVDRLGGLSVAVNTVGRGVSQRTVSRHGPHDLDAFRSIVDLNLVGTFNLNRLQAWHMSRNDPVDGERGVVVNTSSIAAFEGQIGQVAYSATKAAIAGMALTMARDLGSLGIRVLAIAPSLFATGVTANMTPDAVAPLVKDAAFPRRMGHPEEYAKLVLAIVDNQMLNGQCLRLDGGQRFAPK
jgi:NAD(P)-dependent dehydrogenase (short-subunit alcohol dehydrogenase family)